LRKVQSGSGERGGGVRAPGRFRVILTGVRHFRDYARLRDLLDHLPSNRLPDVAVLSRCGRGTDAVATSYAFERGLTLVPHPLNLDRDRADQTAHERRNADMAADADAAVSRRTPRWW
jgi:hypothetical protein